MSRYRRWNELLELLAADPALVDPRRYGAAAREAVAAEVIRLLGVLRAAC